jgi:hypothetical protein
VPTAKKILLGVIDGGMEDTGNTPQFSPVIKIKEKKGHIWQSDIQGVFFFSSPHHEKRKKRKKKF